MQLELIEKLDDDDLVDAQVARLLTGSGPRLVTVRRLPRKVASTAGLLDELKAAAIEVQSFTHPHVLSHLGLFEAGGSYYWITDRTEGFDLGTVFQRLSSREVRITPLRTLQIGVDLLDGVADLQEAGMVHGGIGPRQVVVDLEGFARLDGTGFDKALLSIKELKQKARRGRRDHLPPEVMQGRKPEPSSDVFSTAALLYKLLTGRSPLGEQSQGMSTRHQAVQPPSKLDRSLPFSCDAVFVKALSNAPRQRHESGRSLRNAVHRLRQALVQGSDDGRAGVADFMSGLFPNEAVVAGMPGTLGRPGRGEPIDLKLIAGGAGARSATPQAKQAFQEIDPGFGEEREPETDQLTLSAITAVTQPNGLPAAPAPEEDVGFAETAEPLDGHAFVSDSDIPAADQWDGTGEPTPAFDPSAKFSSGETVPALANAAKGDDGEDAKTEEYQIPVEGDPLLAKVPPTHDTEEMPKARGGMASDSGEQEPSPWKRPLVLILIGLISIALIALVLMASGVLSSDPEIPPTGPPTDRTSMFGFLSVETGNPAQITIDGEIQSGQTPLVKKLLRAGDHRVLVKTSGGKTLLDETIEVAPGEHKEIRLVVPTIDPADRANSPSDTINKPRPGGAKKVRKPVKRKRKTTKQRKRRRLPRKKIAK